MIENVTLTFSKKGVRIYYKELIMIAQRRLIHEIETLPVHYFDEVFDFIGYLKAKSPVSTASAKQAAYQNLLKYKGILPANFDAEKELSEAKEEKYGRFS